MPIKYDLEIRNFDVVMPVEVIRAGNYGRSTLDSLLRYTVGYTLKEAIDLQLLETVMLDSPHAAELEKTPYESVIQIQGIVMNRPSGQENNKMLTGDVEVLVNEFYVLNKSSPNLPFLPRDFLKANETLRLKFRYIDLRNECLQRNLKLRSALMMKFREFLINDHNFIDVETPTLFTRTPGGAQEFIVPTRFDNLFYSLTQSPQQFKQLLMIGGLDRYFQIARCYRDETTRPDRQPEFTQLDIEMSFVTADGIMDLIEKLLVSCWPSHLPKISYPFQRMTYNDAMNYYGSDKPDTTFEMKLVDVPNSLNDHNVGPFSKAMIVPNFADKCSRRMQDLFQDVAKTNLVKLIFVKIDSDKNWISATKTKWDNNQCATANDFFQLKANDVLMLSVGDKEKVLEVLGKLRLQVANILKEQGTLQTDPEAQNLLWITDFPLFLKNSEGNFESAHHPFTAPHPEDEYLVYSDPKNVRGLHYDLVFNGVEIGGGSIRIHNAELQKYIFNHILKEDTTALAHLISALESGCPPHGGIALGLDRLVSIICKSSSIRDVIAFPKSGDGKDLMANAPGPISDADRTLYHIK